MLVLLVAVQMALYIGLKAVAHNWSIAAGEAWRGLVDKWCGWRGLEKRKMKASMHNEDVEISNVQSPTCP